MLMIGTRGKKKETKTFTQAHRAVSRNRYWGTPLPIWVSDDGEEVVVIGSVAELEALSGEKGITDIHRHKIGARRRN